MCKGITLQSIFVFIFVMAAAGAAGALSSNDDNVIGIYFDEQASVNAVDLTPGQSTVAYLAVTNAETATIAGWECALHFEDESLFSVSVDLNGEQLNVLQWPEFAVGAREPISVQTVTVLASMSIMMAVQGETFITIEGLHDYPSAESGLPVYVDGDDMTNLVEFFNVTGYDAQGTPHPCAGINKEFGSEIQTWGSVKSLFR